MAHSAIETADAPAALGPYSQGIGAGGWVFTAGQLGIDPTEGTMKQTIESQTMQALENLKAVLAAAGCGWEKVVKTTVYLKDIGDFAAFNAVYAEMVERPLPARSTVQVSQLPQDALIEIDAIAYNG